MRREEPRPKLTLEGDFEATPCALDRPEFTGLKMDLARLRTHCGSQKMTVAAMHMADMKVWAHRS